MTEEEARHAITAWTKHQFREELDPEPDVEIIEINPRDEDGEEWEAELDVSSSADDPQVTFFMAPEPYGLQIISIDY